MKPVLLFLTLIGLLNTAHAQITVTAADMPVSGDTLRHTTAVIAGSNIDLTQTGASSTWDFSALTPLIQGRDDYKSAAQVSITYALTISANAYGYKVADSLPGSPVPITDIYTFFSKKTGPSRFVAEAFAANLSGFPTPINYSNEDEWYFFPLAFNNLDSSTFKLSFTSPFGSMSRQGKRKTAVDGWGTIVTPYFTTPVNCIRVRSEIEEIDSLSFGGQDVGIPMHNVEYKWLVNGEHYPAMWIVTNVLAGQEVLTSANYRDLYRGNLLSVTSPSGNILELKAYPDPAINGEVSLVLPASWNAYSVECFDVQGRLVLHQRNASKLNVSALPSGQYLVRVISGNETGYVRITK